MAHVAGTLALFMLLWRVVVKQRCVDPLVWFELVVNGGDNILEEAFEHGVFHVGFLLFLEDPTSGLVGVQADGVDTVVRDLSEELEEETRHGTWLLCFVVV